MKLNKSLQTMLVGYKALFKIFLLMAHMFFLLYYLLESMFRTRLAPFYFDLWYFHAGVWIYVSIILAYILGNKNK